MRMPRLTTVCFYGVLLAVFSWAVIFFLYAIADSDNEFTRRPARIIARHQFHDFKHPLQPQPAIAKVKDIRAHHRKNDVVVVEGSHSNPLDASRISSDSDQHEHDAGIQAHAFNEYLSNKLSFHRKIPDTRHVRCSTTVSYDLQQLRAASIIICFYNEALSVLLRSLHSIYDRTDHSLIREIILVDDFSTKTDLKEKLENYIIETFGTMVRIIRNEEREGLIRSRMVGATAARAKVLVFLDSHIEVNVGWLEPLISRLVPSKFVVVMPVIDIIDSDTFQYKASPLVRGGFSWSMRFTWELIPVDLLQSEPLYVSSPTMAGGLFAVSKTTFFNLGGYDNGMDIWGGENIEMSFRVWMCGGKIELALCSRVGHIFRKVRPYSSPTGEDTMTRNTLRMVNVWLDSYKDKYHEATGQRYVNKAYGDVSERLTLRDQLKCYDFDWYLKNVFNPDSKPPPPIHQQQNIQMNKSVFNVVNKGKIKMIHTDLCVKPEGSGKSGSGLVMADCSSTRLKWYELEEGGFLTNKNHCLDVVSSQAVVTKCTGQGGSQQWQLELKQEKYGLLYNPSSGLCLSAQAQDGGQVTMDNCDHSSWFKYLIKSKTNN